VEKWFAVNVHNVDYDAVVEVDVVSADDRIGVGRLRELRSFESRVAYYLPCKVYGIQIIDLTLK
jgi:hypothetical protein